MATPVCTCMFAVFACMRINFSPPLVLHAIVDRAKVFFLHFFRLCMSFAGTTCSYKLGGTVIGALYAIVGRAKSQTCSAKIPISRRSHEECTKPHLHSVYGPLFGPVRRTKDILVEREEERRLDGLFRNYRSRCMCYHGQLTICHLLLRVQAT